MPGRGQPGVQGDRARFLERLRAAAGAAIAGPPTVQRSDLLSVIKDAEVAPLVADDARRVVVDGQDLAGRPRGPPRDRAELLRRLRG